MTENASGSGSPVLEAFPAMTPKQHEVLRFVAENRTSKEIAFELGISESAVNQRIESVRKRTGSPPRAELARVYRQYLSKPEIARPAMPAILAPLPVEDGPFATSEPDETADDLSLAGPAPFAGAWKEHDAGIGMPGMVEDAPADSVRRFLFVAVIIGVLLLVLTGFGVVRALGDLF